MKVSVCLITYNHQDYIKKAIEGILMQKTNFEFEVIIANDCSVDNTEEIIKELILNNRKGITFNYFVHNKNIGMIANFIFSLKKCTGEFIALCEGDDFWTDPLKLQMQVDFFEANSEACICFHKALILKNEELQPQIIPEPFNNSPFHYIELLKHHNFITTASVMFRKPNPFVFPEWFYSLPFGDMGLYKIVSQNKKIQCINEVMSVYRVHGEGLYSGLSTLNARRNYLNFFKIIFPFLNFEEKKVTTLKINGLQQEISKLKFPNKRWLQRCYYAFLRLNIDYK